jgi:excisionase family DNA binding protein
MSIIDQPSELLSIKDAAAYIGVSKASLYRLIGAGALPSVHVLKRKQLISRHDLDTYVNERRSFRPHIPGTNK